MKKIMFLSLVVLCGLYATPSFAGACAAKHLTYVGTQKPQHDEFLYENKTEYDASVNGWTASDDSGNGNGYECDDDACPEGFVLTMGAGHVFKGKVVNKQVSYQCHLFRNSMEIKSDRWVPVDLDNCIYKDTDGQKVLSEGEFVYGRTFTQLSGNCSISDGTLPNWAVNSVAEAEVKTWKVECRKGKPTKKYCMVETCVDGYTLNADGRCVKGDTPVTPVTPTADCDKPGYEIATRDYDLLMPDCGGGVCTPIVKGGCYPKDMLDCAKATEAKQKVVWNGEMCLCLPSGKQLDPKTQRCDGGQNTGLCTQLKQKGASAERLACCYAGGVTKWIGKDSDTDPKLCICVNPTTKVQDPTLEWFYDATTKKGICRAKDNKEPVVTPEPEKDCWYTFYGEFKCGNGMRVKKNYQMKLSKDDLKGLTCESFQEKYRNDARGIEDLFKKLCLDPNYVEQQPLDAATKKAINNINSFFGISESNRNVWRDEDGQFNTTRLASDATAGVVLGTVGGIVSAKVIKKKQLEKGFDVLHCTVGGQKMADYGDTFQVSYQR